MKRKSKKGNSFGSREIFHFIPKRGQDHRGGPNPKGIHNLCSSCGEFGANRLHKGLSIFWQKGLPICWQKGCKDEAEKTFRL